MRAPRYVWSPENERRLREVYADTSTALIAVEFGVTIDAIYCKAHALGLHKSQAYMDSPAASRLRRGDNVGAAFRFRKGHVPANKGVKGISHPGSVATQFKKGRRPHTWTAIGHERVSKEGYLQRKLADTGVTRRDYVAVHHIVWREAGREIPPGFRLTFINRDKTDIRLDNLELVSVADMMKRNSLHTNYPPEVRKLIQLRGALNRKINRKERNHER